MPYVARLLPYETHDGPWNMAADEVLLENAVDGEAAIRFYGWDPATLSLGYFQAYEDRLRDPELAAWPWVRRATGGGAIIHDHDLTYAIAIPASHRAGLVASCWHDRLHHLFTKLLNDRGAHLEVVSGERLPQAALGYRCFAVPQPGDVVAPRKDDANRSKVIGGAQRLRAGAILQHGSIQLPHAAELRDVLARPIADALRWAAEARAWSSAELDRIDELAQAKYASMAWNCKR